MAVDAGGEKEPAEQDAQQAQDQDTPSPIHTTEAQGDDPKDKAQHSQQGVDFGVIAVDTYNADPS